MTLQRLALSRATVDRAAHRRVDAAVLDRLLADPATAVLLLDGDRAPMAADPDPRLVLVDPATAARLRAAAQPADPAADPSRDASPHRAGAAVVPTAVPDGGSAPRVSSKGPVAGAPELVAFLGEDAAGRAYVLLAGPGTTPPARPGSPAPGDDGPDGTPAPDGARWEDLRAVGHLLDDTGAGLMTCAVALANWHGAHPRCSRCGAPTEVIQAGWARSCPLCGAEHYPRTDPAVIMAVVDADDRILLGRQARWPDRRYSTLAGFVEPGEPLEAAVRREVAEEAGVEVGEVVYRGSQPWPFPSSLMLGFRAQALTTDVVVDGAELADARWWTREELALDLATGELLLPPSLSIARRLVEDWYGGPLQDSGGVWR